MIYNTQIGGQDGFLMVNENKLTYDDYVKKKSVRIKSATKNRTLSINKYIPLRFLLVLLREKRLIFKPVTSWEDPYENFFLKEQFVREGGMNGSYSTSVEDITEGLYGMSWSVQGETDSLWRIYSQDKLSVRITTTVEKLTTTICSEDNKWVSWIDKVHYKTEKEINEWLNKCIVIETANQFLNKMGESFFIKRKEFIAEKEYRAIIYFNDQNKRIRPSFICYNIDPNDFISEYIVDPRLSVYEYEGIRAALITAGANKDMIRQSSLYDFIPRKIEMKYDPFEDF